MCVLAAVVWRGAGECRYFWDNERFMLAESGGDESSKLFVWDRWRDSIHVIGDYALQDRGVRAVSHAGTCGL